MEPPSPQRDDPVAARKAQLRKHMVAARDALGDEERARLTGMLMARVLAMPQFASARSVLATMAIGAEWDTTGFIRTAREAGKSIVLPRVGDRPKRLLLYRVADLDKDLVPGVWDIPEPNPDRCSEVPLAEVDFALVPALAADRERYRLGYGAGYFDGLLRGRGPRPYCVTALPAMFVVNSLPHNDRDVPVDEVVVA